MMQHMAAIYEMEYDMKYLLGVDVGTTSLKAVLFDEDATPIQTVTKDYTLNVNGDKIEFPPEQYWQLFSEALSELSAGHEITALSIDTQCETMIVTDADGNPLTDAIVWLDNRATLQADVIREHFGEQKVYEVTGQPEITATWPACKLLWLKEHCPDIWPKIDKIFLLEDYLLYRLTGQFVTEKTLQSSTIYFDIRKGSWWTEMLDFIGISPSQLPAVLDSGKIVGTYNGIKIATSAMDQVAGAIGAGAVKKGIITEMTGTTMVVFVPADTIPAYNPLSKIPCHVNYDGNYCLLSWSPTAGMALKWFKNQFCENYESFDALTELAEQIEPGSNGLTFLPYLCGSTMPKYNPDAKGAFYGLTMEHTRGHAVRSIMEAVSCMLKSNLDYLGIECNEIRSMGGGAKSNLWCQIKADMCQKKIVTLKNDETACLGSAILAGMAAGVFDSVESACAKAVSLNKSYLPSGADYSECYRRFCELEEKNV